MTIGGAGSRASVIVPVTATGMGTARIIAELRGPGDMVLDQNYELAVVPTNPIVARRTTMELAAGGGTLTLGKDLVADMLPGTASVAVSVSPLPEVDVAGLIRDLDLYPYGCSEQTVSRALPLLYLSDLGVDQRILDGGLQERMTAAVARLVNRQAGNGAFGFWSGYGEDSNLWLSSFVTDFMLRAREKGFEVPEDVLVAGLDYLRNMVGNAPDIASGQGQDTAYALYVLARAGRAPVGDLKYLADTKLKDFGSPMARAQIGAALAILGDTKRADTAFASAIKALDATARQDDTTLSRRLWQRAARRGGDPGPGDGVEVAAPHHDGGDQGHRRRPGQIAACLDPGNGLDDPRRARHCTRTPGRSSSMSPARSGRARSTRC